jgi:glycosyltransferase involved in cell wall biosynthesis
MHNSMKRKKVAFLGNQIDWGGGAKSLLLMLKALSNYDYDLYLYVTNIKSKEMVKEFEKYVHYVKQINLPEVVSAQTETIENNLSISAISNIDFSSVYEFIKELITEEIDILHINNSVFSPIYSSLKKDTNISIITHIREWIHWNGIHSKQKYMISNIVMYSDAIICISDVEAEIFKAHPNLHIVSNPFDFNELENKIFDNAKVKKEYGIKTDDLVVGMMGSFQKRKGVFDFIKALSHIKKHYHFKGNIKFIAIGRHKPTAIEIMIQYLKVMFNRNSYILDIYRYIIKNDLSKDFIFVGKRQHVLQIVNCFDIAVRPSYSSDPWGRDIIEYLALKKPIIATGTSSYYIESGKTGYLVPAHDINQMAEKITSLMSSEERRNAMGASGYKKVYDKCNFDNYGNRISSIYTKMEIDNKCN